MIRMAVDIETSAYKTLENNEYRVRASVCDRFKLNSVKITFFVFSAVYLDGKGAL